MESKMYLALCKNVKNVTLTGGELVLLGTRPHANYFVTPTGVEPVLPG